MSRFNSVSTLVSVVFALSISPSYAVQVNSLGFVAPAVDNDTNVVLPAVGEIVYDAGESKLKAYTESGWTALLTGASSTSATSSKALWNLGLASSVAGNALTISLKDASGNTPSANSSPKISFRSSTATTGTYNERSVTNSLSVTISSGSTLGHASAKNAYIYIYAIDNAGTVELAVSSSVHDESTVRSTTAEGGAGASDSRTTLYSTTARTDVAIRLIGKMLSNQTTAGTWAAVPTVISLNPLIEPPRNEIWLQAANGYGSTNTKFRRWTTIVVNNPGTALTLTQSATDGDIITINESGLYSVTYVEVYNGLGGFGIRKNQTANGWLNDVITATEVLAAETSGGNNHMSSCHVTAWFDAGDTVLANGDATASGTFSNYASFRVVKISN